MKGQKRALAVYQDFEILKHAYHLDKRCKQKLSIYSLADLISYALVNSSLMGKKVFFSLDGKLLKAESLTVQRDKIILECKQ